MKVYRLEREGIGPFVMACRKGGHKNKPLFFKKGDNPDTFVYGCDSIENLYKYFENILDIKSRILHNKYEIKEYFIPRKSLRINENNGEIAFPIFYLKREWRHSKDISLELSKRDSNRKYRQFFILFFSYVYVQNDNFNV